MFKMVAGFAVAVFLGATAAAAQSADTFAHGRPDSVSISPSGQTVAVITGTGGKKGNLKIFRYANGKLAEIKGMDLGELPVMDVTFKSDDRILVTVIQENLQLAYSKNKKGDKRVEFSRPLVVSLAGNGGKGLILMPESNFGATIHEALPDDPDHVILEVANVNGGANDLVKVNILTGESELIETGVSQMQGTSKREHYVITESWGTTPDGVTYLRFDHDVSKNIMIVYGRPVGGGWSRLRAYPIVEGEEPVTFLGMASPTTVYAIDRAGDDRRGLWEYDLASGKAIRQVIQAPSGEARAALIDHYKGTLNGAIYMANGLAKPIWVNKSFASAQAAIDDSLADYPLRFISDYSRDHGVLVVHAEGPSQPGAFFLLDARRMELTQLSGSSAAAVPGLGTVMTITYPSSDGRQIVAYLTVPPGGGKNLPLVVMPHGGPESQDDLGYDSWRQFLATRGYVVLQPQFRGSDGFGLAHERAGHGAWGTLVQDDVKYGIDKIVAEGLVDPQRMCIFGWSYGGYMAMAGAALSPDLYKCAIAGAGVSDLDAMLKWEGQNGGRDGPAYEYWTARMGESAVREAASPAEFAANVKIPMLLLHGEEDSTVPIEQSEIMDEALRAAGKQVEFIRYPDQRHSFKLKEESDALKRIEAFLAKYLKP